MRSRSQPAPLADPDHRPDGEFQCGAPPQFEANEGATLAQAVAVAAAVSGGVPSLGKRCSRRHKAVRQSGTRLPSAVRLIVLHSTEGSTALGAATWFTNPASEGSAHLCVDERECYRPLPENVIPWGAPGANTDGLHIEIAGFAGYSRQEWLERKDGLRRAAFKAARLAAKYDIPIRLLSDSQLAQGKRGFTTHAQCSRVFGGSHSDPGLEFPLKRFMRWVREFSDGEPEVPPVPDEPPTPLPGGLGARAKLLAAPRAPAETLERYVLERDHAPRPDREARRIVRFYVELSTAGGLDPLVPIAQMVLETGNLKSPRSQPPFRNLAGIGVTSTDADPAVVPRFRNWKAAVTAHVGRLIAYAVPPGQETPEQLALVVPALRARPLSPAVHGHVKNVGGLEGTWATAEGYARALKRLGDEIRQA
ncbi:MAG TPA: N-acetylmuramoyl-L-alanine amidase [Gaiellaceae bacterium]|nr:N-acetylmuramoyl-L-alanine amidase [Gaiellaceae bacterium]